MQVTVRIHVDQINRKLLAGAQDPDNPVSDSMIASMLGEYGFEESGDGLWVGDESALKSLEPDEYTRI